ncbi:MAG: response regulator [Desulfohalobiaceae bacterium]|nr:response regulator [Desulfohalobiaceae bacterium]
MSEKHKKILILDDEASVCRTLGRLVHKIGREYDVVHSAEEAKGLLQKESYELILSDIRLPGESGLDFVREAVSHDPELAVIMITGVDDPEVVEEALELGAYGYIVKPFKVSEVLINISSALRRRQLEAKQRAHEENLERTVAERTEKLQEALEGVIQVVARTVEARDPYTAGHQQRVAELAAAIAGRMGLNEDTIQGITMAGTIHDLGKIAIPAEVLSKPTRLSEIEFGLIKNHSQMGHDILSGIEFQWPLARMVLQHHEKLDGSGYPNGCSGDEILQESRILTVADVVEAMASHRPYRAGLGIEKALEEIRTNKGRFFDPEAVEACLELFEEDGFQWAVG